MYFSCMWCSLLFYWLTTSTLLLTFWPHLPNVLTYSASMRLGMGYSNWSYCITAHTIRSFTGFSVGTFAKATSEQFRFAYPSCSRLMLFSLTRINRQKILRNILKISPKSIAILRTLRQQISLSVSLFSKISCADSSLFILNCKWVENLDKTWIELINFFSPLNCY